MVGGAETHSGAKLPVRPATDRRDTKSTEKGEEQTHTCTPDKRDLYWEDESL